MTTQAGTNRGALCWTESTRQPPPGTQPGRRLRSSSRRWRVEAEPVEEMRHVHYLDESVNGMDAMRALLMARFGFSEGNVRTLRERREP